MVRAREQRAKKGGHEGAGHGRFVWTRAGRHRGTANVGGERVLVEHRRKIMISRTAFCSAQPAVILEALKGPMPDTSFSRSGLASIMSNVASPNPATIPPPRLKRWVAGRKAEVLAAVDCGLLSVDEACVRYGIGLDEFLSWKRAVGRAGLRGLSVKRVQDHRPRRVERARKCW